MFNTCIQLIVMLKRIIKVWKARFTDTIIKGIKISSDNSESLRLFYLQRTSLVDTLEILFVRFEATGYDIYLIYTFLRVFTNIMNSQLKEF